MYLDKTTTEFSKHGIHESLTLKFIFFEKNT
jgi:hypothetical protein